MPGSRPQSPLGIFHCCRREQQSYTVKERRCGQRSVTVVMQPAATRHRIRNGSESEDLVFYVIANEHQEDTVQKFIV